jgi:transposase
VIAPHLPKPCATGRPRAWPMREIVNGIFYVMRAGCPWRLLPNDLPPWGTIYRWFAAWRDDGCFERINHAIVMAACGAKTRAGLPCQCPAIRDRRRCRLHGGLSPGAPRGEKNRNYKTGEWTNDAIAERRWLRSMQSFCKIGTIG